MNSINNSNNNNFNPQEPIPTTDHHLPEQGSDNRVTQKATELLNASTNESISEKQFASIHASSILTNTGLEGVDPKNTVSYWISVLNRWNKEDNNLVDPGLTKDEIQNIKSEFETSEKFIEYAQNKDFDKTACQKLLVDTLKDRGSLYFPITWTGLPAGHFMLIKFSLHGDNVHLELLTKGAGAEFHDILSHSVKKITYSSDVFVVEKKKLESETGKSFIQRLVLLGHSKVHSKDQIQELDSEDLYGLVMQFSDKKQQRERESSEKELITQQRSGTCGSSGWKMVVFESLNDSTDPEILAKRKKVMYAFKLQSLVDGYRVFHEKIKQGDPQFIKLFEQALHEHFTRLSKLYPEVINKDELSLGLALGKEIELFVQKARENIKREMTPTVPDLESSSENKQNNVLVSFSGDANSTSLQINSSPKIHLPPLPEEIPGPAEITDQLGKWLKEYELADKENAGQDKNLMLAHQYYQLMIKLPLPVDESKTPYWNTLPVKDRIQCVENLKKMAMLANKLFNHPRRSVEDPSRLFVTNSIAYDIACQIAPQISELKIGSRMDFEWRPARGLGRSFLDPVAHSILNKIGESFEQRTHHKGLSLDRWGGLFPGSFSVNDKDYPNQPIYTHWIYAKQFFTPDVKKKIYEKPNSGGDRNAEQVFLMDEDKQFFPKSYYDLQELSYLATNYDSDDLQVVTNSIREENLWEQCAYGSNLHMRDRMTNALEGHEGPKGDNHLIRKAPFLNEFFKDAKYNENDVLINQPELKGYSGKEAISKQLAEEIALLENLPENLVIPVMGWAKQNLKSLTIPAIQGVIQRNLLEKGLLIESLKEKPEETVQRIQDFIFTVLDIYGNDRKHKDIVFWLAKISFFIEKTFHSFEVENKTINMPNFFPILRQYMISESDPLKKIELLNLMVLSFYGKFSGELTEDEIAKLVAVKIEMEMKVDRAQLPDVQLVREAVFTMHSHLPQIWTQFEKASQGDRDRLLNMILDQLFVPSTFQLSWTRHEGQCVFSSGAYVIDIERMRISKNNEELLDVTSLVSNSRDYQTIFQNQPFISTKKENFYYKQPEEKIRVAIQKDRSVKIQKLMMIQGKEVWCEYCEKIQKGVPIPNDLFIHHQFWNTCEKPSSILAMNKNSKKFGYQYCSNLGWTKLDPETGGPTNERVVDIISENTVREKWGHFLKFIEPPEQIMLAEKKNVEGNWVISSLNFTRLGLSFSSVKMGSTTRLKSEQFEGYYLAASQEVPPPSDQILGAIVLEDLTGKLKQIIIPAKGIVKESPGLHESKEAKQGEVFATLRKTHEEEERSSNGTSNSFKTGLELDHNNVLIKEGVPYFSYFIDSNHDKYTCESPKASLFLSLLLRNCQKFSEAKYYLDKSESMESNDKVDWHLVDQLVIKRPRQYIPSQAAYDLHLKNRMNMQSIKHTKRPAYAGSSKEFDKLIEDQMHYYQINAEGYKKDVAAIPKELRMSISEKSPHTKKEINSLSNLPSKVNFSYFDEQGKAFIKDICQCTLEKSEQMQLQSDFVRLDRFATSEYSETSLASIYLKYHFFDLFKRCIHATQEEKAILEMDLFFLSRNDDTKSEDNQNVIGLLSIALKHPGQFQKIVDVKNRTEEALQKQFLEIIKLSKEVMGRSGDVLVMPSSNEPMHRKLISSPDVAMDIQLSLKGKLEEVVASEIKPLKTTFDTFFMEIPSQSNSTDPFVLDSKKTTSSLGKKIVEALEEGHQLNQQLKTKSYVLIDDSKLPELIIQMKEDLNKNEWQLKKLTKDIEELANKLPSTESEIEMAKRLGRQVKKLTLDDPLVSCFMAQDTRTLLEWNPALNEKDVLELFQKMTQLFLTGRHLHLVENTLIKSQKLLKTNVLEEKRNLTQEIGELLDTSTQYHIEDHLEYLVYEYATGKVLRKDQVELLDWIFDSVDKPNLENLLFQFQAGGGKTKVLMPILAFKLSQLGYFPVLVNTNSQYEIGKRDLDQSLSAAFKQRIELLEIDLGTEMDYSRLSQIHDSLKGFRTRKKCLTIKPETMSALLIARQKAFEAKDEKYIQKIKEIINFFEDKKTIALIDEAHLALDSMQEADYAIGSSKTLPKEYLNVFLDMIYILAGFKDSNFEIDLSETKNIIAQKVRLMQNQQALLNESDMGLIRETLVSVILSRPPFCYYLDQPHLKEYLLNIVTTRPEWINQLHASEKEEDKLAASTIVLVRQYLNQLMQHTLSLIQGVDYGASIDPDEYFCCPKHKKQDVSSKFQDVMVTAALTIQNATQTGLTEAQLKIFMENFLAQHKKEAEHLEDSSQSTTSQELFNSWMSSSFSLDVMDLQDRASFDEIKNQLAHHPEVIELFLKEYALSQIEQFSEKISVTPPEFLAAFGRTIAFSATPGPMALYPAKMQKTEGTRLDLGFEAAVVKTLCGSDNHKMTAVDFHSLESLFEEIDQKNPNLIKNITTLIDSGALFRRQKNEEVIGAFLKFLEKKNIPKDGGICKQPHEVGSHESSLTLLNLENELLYSRALEGSDLPGALKKIGKDFDALLLVTLFGLEDTTGADYKQPYNGCALLTVGELQTKTQTIQAAMRMRRLLLSSDNQTVHWMITKELASQIPAEKRDQLTVQELLMWMIENESTLQERAIVMRTYQGIKHIMKKKAWSHILEQPTSAQQIEVYQKYRALLVDKLESDPFYLYEETTLQDTKEVLTAYALKCYSGLGFNDKDFLGLHENDRKDLNLLIEQTATLIPQIHTGEKSLSSEMFQQQEVKQEQKQEQKQQVEQESVSFGEKYSPVKEDDLQWGDLSDFEGFFKTTLNSKAINDKLGVDFIPDDIYISPNYFYFLRPKIFVGDIPLFIKPFKYVLVIQDDKAPCRFVPCTYYSAKKYKEVLKKTNLGTFFHQRKAMLMDVSGRIVQNGYAKSGFSEKEFQTLKASNVLDQRMTLLTFLNGKIKNLSVLSEITKDWDQEKINQTWKTIGELKFGLGSMDHRLKEELLHMKRRKVPFKRGCISAKGKKFISATELSRYPKHLVNSKYHKNSALSGFLGKVSQWFFKPTH